MNDIKRSIRAWGGDERGRKKGSFTCKGRKRSLKKKRKKGGKRGGIVETHKEINVFRLDAGRTKPFRT